MPRGSSVTLKSWPDLMRRKSKRGLSWVCTSVAVDVATPSRPNALASVSPFSMRPSITLSCGVERSASRPLGVPSSMGLRAGEIAARVTEEAAKAPPRRAVVAPAADAECADQAIDPAVRIAAMAILETRGKIPGRTTSKWPLLPPSGGRYG